MIEVKARSYDLHGNPASDDSGAHYIDQQNLDDEFAKMLLSTPY
ncbi:MAG: hypothetical protein R2827_11580 [Bdellovibrionales bacterium]